MLINSIARCRLDYLALECIGKAWATTDCVISSSCSEIQWLCLTVFSASLQRRKKMSCSTAMCMSSLALRHLNDNNECSFYNKKLLEQTLEKEKQKII